MNLPEKFCERMKEMLGDEYPAFCACFDTEPVRSLRVNTLKETSENFCQKNLFSLDKVSWCADGFYFNPAFHPGSHPYHSAGVYYIQEASRMSVAYSADIRPGQKVLDLCAAPGGKSSRAAALLQGQGLLVANEIVPSRAKILSRNLERMGVVNRLVLNENPRDLEDKFPSFFDRVLVDAPCSGEGMFRKDKGAIVRWNEGTPAACAARQALILESADKMLSAGGKLVYSTCTFSPEENEGVISRFLKKHPEYVIEKPEIRQFFSPGIPQYGDNNPRLINCIRLYPHKIKGEGHFIAVLVKTDGENKGKKALSFKTDKKITSVWQQFEKENFTSSPLPEGYRLYTQGDDIYAISPDMPDFKGHKVIRAGLYLGNRRKGRFIPSHALALSQGAKRAVRKADFTPDSDVLKNYLAGMEIPDDSGQKGYVIISVDGHPLGWGKSDGRVIKNHYPKGLRLKNPDFEIV